MANRLNSDDLDLLSTVQGLGAAGWTERAIAHRLGLEPEQLRCRLGRIRAAFESLNRVATLATGEQVAPEPARWEIVIDEPCEAVGCGSD